MSNWRAKGVGVGFVLGLLLLAPLTAPADPSDPKGPQEVLVASAEAEESLYTMWIKKDEPKVPKTVEVEEISKDEEKNKLMNDFNIHSGEAEAILLFLDEKADLLGTDDYQTLKTCKVLNIHFFTTPLFLLQSVTNRKIEKSFALRKIDRLSKLGWYKDEIIEYFMDAIKKVG